MFALGTLDTLSFNVKNIRFEFSSNKYVCVTNGTKFQLLMVIKRYWSDIYKRNKMKNQLKWFKQAKSHWSHWWQK